MIDDREGIPITLAVLYIELGRRLGIAAGGRRVARTFRRPACAGQGRAPTDRRVRRRAALTKEEAGKKVEDITGRRMRDENLAAIDKRAIVVRMLHNLLSVAQNEKDKDGMLRYVNAIVTVDPKAAQERGLRRTALPGRRSPGGLARRGLAAGASAGRVGRGESTRVPPPAGGAGKVRDEQK